MWFHRRRMCCILQKNPKKLRRFEGEKTPTRTSSKATTSFMKSVATKSVSWRAGSPKKMDKKRRFYADSKRHGRAKGMKIQTSGPEIRPVHHQLFLGQRPQKRLQQPWLSVRPRPGPRYSFPEIRRKTCDVDPYEARNPKGDYYGHEIFFNFQASRRCLLVQAVVVVFGVVGLRRVDEGQSGSPEMSSVACSSEIKEDGLRFVLRLGDNQPQSRLFWEQRTAM